MFACGEWVLAFDDSSSPRCFDIVLITSRSRIGIITRLFDRKSEYRTRTIAGLFYERVERYDE